MLNSNICDTGLINVVGHVQVFEDESNVLLLDKKNAIHPQNMSRIIAKALANEPNSSIYRIAFGNGGTITVPTGEIVFKTPNDGRDGSWESRLYNETYSEVVDETSSYFGTDPGSSEPGNVRTGGGARPDDDPPGGGVVSQEVGDKSNVVITVVLNRHEPSGQLNTINDFGGSIDGNERTFIFDEVGLYSSGKSASPTSGYTSVDVGGKTSSDICSLQPNVTYDLIYSVDGDQYTTAVRTPNGGTGMGGGFTYGDLCEGLNTGAWIISGDIFSSVAYAFITDSTNGLEYPTIANKESYGFLTFQSNSVGVASTIELECTALDPDNLITTLTSNVCSNANINKTDGDNAGIMNDPINSSNERERLLSHLIFPPIAKMGDKALRIVYTLTVSISRTNDSQQSQTTT